MHTKSNPQDGSSWPDSPKEFPPIMTPTEAAQFLRLNQTAHSPGDLLFQTDLFSILKI